MYIMFPLFYVDDITFFNTFFFPSHFADWVSVTRSFLAGHAWRSPNLPINRPNQPTTAQSLPSGPALHLAHRSTKLTVRLSVFLWGPPPASFPQNRSWPFWPLSALGLTFSPAYHREEHLLFVCVSLCRGSHQLFDWWSSLVSTHPKKPLNLNNPKRNKPTIVVNAVWKYTEHSQFFSSNIITYESNYCYNTSSYPKHPASELQNLDLPILLARCYAKTSFYPTIHSSCPLSSRTH